MIWSAPIWPVFAWTPTLSGTVDIYNGTTTTEVLLSDLAGPGFAVSGSMVATAASLHGKLCAALSASSGGTVVPTYVLPDGDAGPLLVSMQRTGGTATCTAEFSSLAAAQAFGFDDVGPHSFTTIAPRVTDHNHDGVWRPACFGAMWSTDLVMPGRGVSVPVGDDPPVLWSWGRPKRQLTLTFPDVRRANIEVEAAATSTYAAAALRDVADPNGTLEGLATAACSGDADSLRFWRSVSDSEVLYWRDRPDRLSDLYDSDSQQAYRVTLTLRREGNA